MSYLITPIYPHIYCLLIPPQFSSQNSIVNNMEFSQYRSQKNAEINQTQKQRPFQIQKIIITKQDLLKEGYQQIKRAWSEQEDNILLQLCKDQNIRFEEVAQKIPGRNSKMCYSRYRRLSNQSKECWTKVQDERLRGLIQEYGTNSWKQLAKHFPNRNFKQLKDHYENYLRPDLSTQEWTLEEDLQLIDLYNMYGKEWNIIQKSMYWRSRNQLKNRLCGRILRLDAKKRERSEENKHTIKNQLFIY